VRDGGREAERGEEEVAADNYSRAEYRKSAIRKAREYDDFYRDLVKAAWRLQRFKRRYGI